MPATFRRRAGWYVELAAVPHGETALKVWRDGHDSPAYERRPLP